MGSNDHTKQKHADLSPPLEALIHAIDRQVDRVPHPHAAKGFEDFWGSQIGEYKKPDQQYIRFTLNGDVFGVPLQNAVEIDYLPDITPLPNLPHWVLGICSLRGDLVSVVDIKQIFGLESNGAAAVKKLILVRNEEISTAVVADKILGMLFADEHHLHADTGSKANKAYSGYVQSTIAMDRQSVHLLDVDKLMKTLQLQPSE